jgi:hypothetical protein
MLVFCATIGDKRILNDGGQGMRPEQEHRMAADETAETETGNRTEEAAAEEREEESLLSTQELNAMIESVCNSKAEEFRMLGYDRVTGKEVWDCVSSKYKDMPPLHRIVNDILSLKTTQLMNWMTMTAWKLG